MLFLILIIGGILMVWLLKGLQNDIRIHPYDLQLLQLPRKLDGLRIVHLSDLHSRITPDLREQIDSCQPDLIVCSGDLFDGVQFPEQTAAFLGALAQTYPVYMVTGNHEHHLASWPYWRHQIQEAGVHLLENKMEPMEWNGTVIEISGIDDLGCTRSMTKEALHQSLQKRFSQLPDPEHFRILLFHRASLLREIPESSADLVFSGHLHGGQWRIFGAAICGPGDTSRLGLFPKFSKGEFHQGRQTRIVSAGLGDQMRIPRFYNPPELVLVTLHAAAQESQGGSVERNVENS